MRRTFAEVISQEIPGRPIHVLSADLGFGMWDNFAAACPSCFHNVGAAEQLMVGAAVGLALAGRIPICYSITPFVLYRPFEIVRNYLDHEQVPVKLVGSGRGHDYAHDGFTHWAEDDRTILACFPNIVCYWPETVDELRGVLGEFLSNGKPSYLNLRR